MKNNSNTLKRGLGLFAATSIVFGNMVGSGIFGLPGSLAIVSSPTVTIIAWLFASIGSMFIVVSYAKLGTKFPESGGPVLFTKKAFGNFSGFMMSWLWWFGSWIGNAAIITLLVTNIDNLIPSIGGSNSTGGILVGFFLIGLFTVINIVGVRIAGWFSILTTILKFVVFIVWMAIAIPHFDASNFSNVSTAASSNNLVFSFSSAIILVMWAFTGLDSATLAGGEIKNPEKNITRSSVLGVGIAGVLYLMLTVIMIGFYSQESLSKSDTPFSSSIDSLFNTNIGGKIISLAIVLTVVGTLSGWILITARSPYQAAKGGMFFKSFGHTHKKFKTPVFSLVISGILTGTILLIPKIVEIISKTSDVRSNFDNIITLAGLVILPAYVVIILSELKLTTKSERSPLFYLRNIGALLFSLTFLVLGFYGSGLNFLYYAYAFAFVAVGILLYLIVFKKRSAAEDLSQSLDNN